MAKGIGKERLLKMIPIVNRELKAFGGWYIYQNALRDIQSLLICAELATPEPPETSVDEIPAQIWRHALAKTNGKKRKA